MSRLFTSNEYEVLRAVLFWLYLQLNPLRQTLPAHSTIISFFSKYVTSFMAFLAISKTQCTWSIIPDSKKPIYGGHYNNSVHYLFFLKWPWYGLASFMHICCFNDIPPSYICLFQGNGCFLGTASGSKIYHYFSSASYAWHYWM